MKDAVDARLPAGASAGPATGDARLADEGRLQSDGRTKHGSLLISAAITDDDRTMSSLVALLESIAHPAHGIDLEENPVVPFRRLTSVHFARLLILPASGGPPSSEDTPHPPTSPVPAQLLFGTDFDGSLRDHLLELIDVAADGLDQLFGHCAGWLPLTGKDRRSRYLALAEFVGRHATVANTFYTGTMNRSVTQILREATLRDAIDGFLDRHAGTEGFPADAAGVHRRIRNWVFSDPQFTWLNERPGPMPKPLVRRAITNHATPVAVAFIALTLAASVWLLSMVVPLAWALVPAVTIVAIAAAAYAFLCYLNATDPVIIGGDVQSRTRALVTSEDRIFQNQITTINYIKRPLWFRRGVLRLVLAVIHLGARFVDNQGSLSGIPSIHFARWVIVDGGRRLLFFSNFDGTWESYLGDFVDKAHKGLTAIWSNAVGFPRTKGLSGEGALDEQPFKALARDSQVATHVWYSAYPPLTVSNINDNTRLRQGLYLDMNESAAQAWLRMTVPRERRTAPLRPIASARIEVDDVQGLVARSYRDLEHAAYVPVTFDQADATRTWLQELLPRVTTALKSSAEVGRDGEALNIAFTRAGLRVLGLSDAAVVGFSREFTEGMAGPDRGHRQRMLGDVGRAAPSSWDWGGPNTPGIDAMLFVFARTAADLERLLGEERERAGRHGVSLHGVLSTQWLGLKEHFGFDDGIAQPGIAGLHGEGESGRHAPEIPPGEVLLGYPNAYERMPLSPTVEETGRSARHLQRAAPDPAGLARPRDFGRNGSYVVFRQLEQDVKAFWEDLHHRAEGDPGRRAALAAKMIGRWPNGAPLVRFPSAPPEHPEGRPANDFVYAEDLDGDRCPIGAHIRRTNPRDGLRPNTHESLIVSGRHRLLRRGRAYGPPLSERFDPDEVLRSEQASSARRGLHFICFNSDIARQFEFVQSTWMNNPKFDGLYCDPDPVMSPHSTPRPLHTEEINRFTIQSSPVRRRYANLAPFVTMVGGCYLFMPGVRAMRYLVDIEGPESSSDPVGSSRA